MAVTVICPLCQVPYTRHGGVESSHFYRTKEENEQCILCRERLALEDHSREKLYLGILIAGLMILSCLAGAAMTLYLSRP